MWFRQVKSEVFVFLVLVRRYLYSVVVMFLFHVVAYKAYAYPTQILAFVMLTNTIVIALERVSLYN